MGGSEGDSSFLGGLLVAGSFPMLPAPQEELEGIGGHIQTRAKAKCET